MSQVKFEKIYELAKGIDTYTRDTMLKEDETANASNVIAVGKNSIAKRKGTVLLCTVATAGSVNGLGTWTSAADKQLLAMVNGTLYQIQSGTAVAVSAAPASAGVFTPNLSTDFCQGGANVYISNGTDAMRVYDGTTVRVQTNGVIAKYNIYYKNCLYAMGNPTYPSRLYRSGADTYIGDFTNSTANALATSINISNNDGQDLTSFWKYQDYLYNAKNRSTYRVTVATDSVATMAYEMVDSAKGSDSHKATDAVENDIYMYNEYGVHSLGFEPNYLDQVRTKVLSLRVDDELQAIEKDVLADTCGMYFDNVYHFSYKSGGATANDKMLVYDRQRAGWWSYNLGASHFCEYKNSSGVSYLYYGSATDAKVYYFTSAAKSDNGSAISTVWLSPKYTLKDYTQSKFFLGVVFYVGNIPGEVTFSVFVDGVLINTKTVNLGPTDVGGIGTGMLGESMFGVEGGSEASDVGGSGIVKLAVNKMGRNIQVKITESSTDKGWELNGLDVSYVKINKLYQPGTE